MTETKSASREPQRSGETPALEGYTIIDLSQGIVGPMCANMAGGVGARVIKVELLNGDLTRNLTPIHEGTGVIFSTVNSQKESIAIDYSIPQGNKILRKLLMRANAVILGNPDLKSLKRAGLDKESLSEINPGIIVVAISAFGHTGPRVGEKGYDLVMQANSGAMTLTGPQNDSTPYRYPGHLIDVLTAQNAFNALLVAILEKNNQLKPEVKWLDISLLNSSAAPMMHHLAKVANDIGFLEKSPPFIPTDLPYGVVKTSDGYMVVALASDTHWPGFCQAIGRSDLLTDPRIKIRGTEVVEGSDVLAEIINHEIGIRPTAELVELFKSYKVPAEPIRDIEGFLREAQTIERGVITTLSDVDSGREIIVASHPLAHSGIILSDPGFPPELGRDTNRILEEIGYSLEEIGQFRTSKIVI